MVHINSGLKRNKWVVISSVSLVYLSGEEMTWIQEFNRANFIKVHSIILKKRA